MKKFSLILVFAAVGLMSLPAWAQESAAKQKPKPRHVWTNEDFADSGAASAPANGAVVSGAPSGSAAASSAESKPGAEAKPEDAKAADPAAKPEDGKPADEKDAKAAEKSKIGDLQDQLAQAKHDEADLQKKLDDLQAKADGEQSDFRRNMYLDMISNQQVTLAEYRRKQEQLQQQIDQEKSKTEKAQ